MTLPRLPRRCLRSAVFGMLLLAPASPGLGQPRAVMASIQINSITEIDSARETFRADFYVTLRWRDPALLNVDPDQVDWSKTRKPSIEIMNSQDAAPLGEEVLRVESQGMGYSETRYAGTFSNRMDLEDFPFDEQILSIALESQNEDANKMVFSFRPIQGGAVDIRGRTIPVPQKAILSQSIHLPEWTLAGTSVHESTSRYYGGTEPYSRVQFDVTIDRRVGYYIWKVMSVLVMLVVLSWVIFLIDPADIGNRMAVSITLFLAAVAFAFVTSGLIPRISYLTLLDLYILGCYVLLFLAPVESLLVYRLRDKSWARRIDRLSLVGFPAAFLLLHVLIWMRS